MRYSSAHLRSLFFMAMIVLAACSDSHGRDDGGLDAGGATDAGGSTDGGAIDGGPLAPCEAQRVTVVACPEAPCRAAPTWFWNGDSCFPIDCGACEGEDCGLGVLTQDECEAAHASCEASRCRATDGDWLWWVEECGHYECGVPPPAICEVGSAACDCGPRRRFEPAVGCVDDPACPVEDDLSREALCTSSGGSWDAICCDTECGVFCDLACAAMACNCGPGRVFDDARGCIDGPRCHERRLGETCDGVSRCESGSICCTRCGGAGCEPSPTCTVPVCDTDPNTDECGNNLLAP